MVVNSAIRIVESKPNDFIGAWLSSLSDKTAEAYSSDIGQFFEWLGHDDIQQITRSDCQRYKGFLLNRYSKPATANRKLTAVRCMLVEAVQYGHIAVNPAVGIRGQKRENQYSPTKCPSDEEIRDVFASIGGDSLLDLRDRALIAIAASMGLRRSEIADLTTECISDTMGKTVLRVTGKGNKTRQMVVPANALQALLKWMAVAQITTGPIFRPIINGAVGDRALDPSTVYVTIVRRLEAAGITGCSPHSLRHYNLTRLFKRGARPDQIQRWAGHADPRTTQGYNHAQEDINDSPAELAED